MAKHVMDTQVIGREKACARVASKSFLRVVLYKVREKKSASKINAAFGTCKKPSVG